MQLDPKALEAAVEAAKEHIEIDGDNEGPFIRFDSIETGTEAAITTYLQSATTPSAEVVAKARHCATDGCERPAITHFDSGGIGSYYCETCMIKISALAPRAPEVSHETQNVEGKQPAVTDELAQIEAMLNEGQGDDDGLQIMPEFDEGASTLAKVEECLHLLEKRRDIIMAYENKPTPAAEPVADEKERWQAWARKRLEIQSKHWLRAAKDALNGDFRELRNRVELAEAEPVDVVLSAAALAAQGGKADE